MSNTRQNSRSHNSIGDVTIYEHANSDVKAQRLKKGNLIHREKVFDTIGGELPEDKKSRRRNKKISESEDILENHLYNDYHVDIWFLISEYLQPEDIGRFAGICSKTNHVIHTAKFWFHMYKNNYRFNDEMPKIIQPDNIEIGGLRASVIRSLFYIYEPFVLRTKCINKTPDYQCLIKQRCVGLRYMQEKSLWIFCYKFKHKSFPEDLKKSREKNIFSNDEEGCKILVITTPGFRPLPELYGNYAQLSNITQTLSSGFTTNKLKLEFRDNLNHLLDIVVYDPIKGMNVFDWWEPNYYKYL